MPLGYAWLASSSNSRHDLRYISPVCYMTAQSSGLVVQGSSFRYTQAQIL